MDGNAAPQVTDQHSHVESVMDLPDVVDLNDDEMVSHELEQMRSILEEANLETRSMPHENRPQLFRIAIHKQPKLGCREGS
ncbi:unnamed protein product [Parnassius apollo]|uniref:(apollo) hypothetical protein n=1 Tax=Parnassius apollo TaxID=110799 RepID=A0A8S3Y5T2_PARAO|nr:unnamed protein product [Parnassius apollo]